MGDRLGLDRREIFVTQLGYNAKELGRKWQAAELGHCLILTHSVPFGAQIWRTAGDEDQFRTEGE